MISVQVGASALLLISAAIFLQSALGAATVNPGVRTSDTMMVNIVNEVRRAALLQAVTAHPLVAAVAASSPRTRAAVETAVVTEAASPVQPETEAGVRLNPDTTGALPDAATGTRSSLPVDQIAVSPEYLDVLDIDVVRGRGFTQAERTAAAGVVIVTDTVARRLWPTGDAVGQVV